MFLLQTVTVQMLPLSTLQAEFERKPCRTMADTNKKEKEVRNTNHEWVYIQTGKAGYFNDILLLMFIYSYSTNNNLFDSKFRTNIEIYKNQVTS